MKAASSEAVLSPAVIAVILIKYLDEEYLFLCNIYNAVNRLHDEMKLCSRLSLKRNIASKVLSCFIPD